MTARGQLLFEIGCEEIPAGMIAKAANELKQILETHLVSNRLASAGSVETFGAPRRLVAIAREVALKQDDIVQEILGPPKSVAYDSVGAPTRAALSFADKQGIALEEIEIVVTPKGEYLAIKKVIVGRLAKDVLAEILPQAIRELSFPRSMYWTSASELRFIRPIRWIVAELDGKVVPFTIAGVKAGASSSGHRFLGKAKIPVSTPADYVSKLRKNFVIVHPEDRRKKIEKEVQFLLEKKSLVAMNVAFAKKALRLYPDPSLMNLVTYLNEYPSAIIGNFDPAYLELPKEILITVMRGHQKYFAIENKHGGLEPHFIAIINLDRDRQGLVRGGHERVLRARFADARFFWDSDMKKPLAEYLPRLKHVTYESRLGSYHDKVERVRALARWLANTWSQGGVLEAHADDADRAAELAKCDLVTDMVREFPELQGIVGGLYARAQGEAADVAWAVYDHYRPVGLDDPIPRNLAGCAVALADKLDSLVGCFAIGAIPSGSSDPFALRRAALGIVKILLERKLPLSLSSAISTAANGYRNAAHKVEVTPAAEVEVLAFMQERARYVLREKHGFAYDEVNAALAAGGDDLVDATARVEALKAIRGTRNFTPLAAAFKRIRKILEKAQPLLAKSGLRMSAVRPELFREKSERELYEVSQAIGEKARAFKNEARYREALEVIAGLRPAVDRFFDDVLVMAEEEDLRVNRLSLLSTLLKEFSTIADFSEMVSEDAA
jgi:glycyl-tRNA synthetase beta chain